MDRLIDVPAVRDPSPGLLHRLRQMDARAEVLYVGAGRWWVGRVKRDSARRPVGRQMVVAIQAGDGFPDEPGKPSDRWPEFRQALLMSQGFGLVCDVTVYGEPDALLVREFMIAMYVERGGQFVSEDEREWESRRRDRIRENRIRDRELTRWLFKRSPNGRGNPWVSMSHRQEVAV